MSAETPRVRDVADVFRAKVANGPAIPSVPDSRPQAFSMTHSRPTGLSCAILSSSNKLRKVRDAEW